MHSPWWIIASKNWQTMRSRTENKKLEKRLNLVAIAVSVVVFVMVVAMRRIRIETDINFGFLPPLHSSLNALAAVFLILAILAIRKRNVRWHHHFMISAVVLSVLFLISYVTYHLTTPETPFCKEGVIRYVYFTLLITHILLAAVILPFILFTLIRAITMQRNRHKKLARWVYPIWLYVAVSGPILYLMLRDCY